MRSANHAAYVEAWLERAAKSPKGRSLPPATLVLLFERAMGALWQRAEVTLGEVSLSAIVDRVLYTASETYPFLSTLKIDRTGIRFDDFRQQCQFSRRRDPSRQFFSRAFPPPSGEFLSSIPPTRLKFLTSIPPLA